MAENENKEELMAAAELDTMGSGKEEKNADEKKEG